MGNLMVKPKLDFSGGLWTTSTGQHVRIDAFSHKTNLWYGIWVEKEMVVTFDKSGNGVSHEKEVGMLMERSREGKGQ